MNQEFVIRKSFWGNLLFALVCVVFAIIGYFMIQSGKEVFWGYIVLIFFGGGGVLYMALMSWKPIVIICKEGVAVPHGFGKQFMTWENLDRIEMIEQNAGGAKQKYIALYPKDDADEHKISHAITQNLTGWKEVPSLLINNSFTFVKYEKILKALNESWEKRKNEVSKI